MRWVFRLLLAVVVIAATGAYVWDHYLAQRVAPEVERAELVAKASPVLLDLSSLEALDRGSTRAQVAKRIEPAQRRLRTLSVFLEAPGALATFAPSSLKRARQAVSEVSRRLRAAEKSAAVRSLNWKVQIETDEALLLGSLGRLESSPQVATPSSQAEV